MTFSTTHHIFVCLYLNNLDDKYDYTFQQFTENQCLSAKDKYKSLISSSKLNKRLRLERLRLRLELLRFRLQKKHATLTLIYIPQPWLKLKQDVKSHARLGFASPKLRLVSVSNHRSRFRLC